MEIVEGGTYLFAPRIENKVYIWGEKEYNQIKPCLFKEMSCSLYQVTPRYAVHRFDFKFEDIDSHKVNHIHMMYEPDLTGYVFKDIEDYLQYLIAESKYRNEVLEENRKKKGVLGKRKLKKFILDDFLQNKILESQENHPERWI